jgi:hypothetical protein
MLLSICVDQCQEDDDGQQSSQNRGAIRIKISIFLIVLDGFRSDVVPNGRNHASQAKNSQQILQAVSPQCGPSHDKHGDGCHEVSGFRSISL